jgi:hypothetical protein
LQGTCQLKQPGENLKIYKKSGEKNVRWRDIQCSIMNTLLDLERDLKRVLIFPVNFIYINWRLFEERPQMQEKELRPHGQPIHC